MHRVIVDSTYSRIRQSSFMVVVILPVALLIGFLKVTPPAEKSGVPHVDRVAELHRL